MTVYGVFKGIFLALEATAGGSRIKGNLDYIGLCLEGRKKLNQTSLESLQALLSFQGKIISDQESVLGCEWKNEK